MTIKYVAVCFVGMTVGGCSLFVGPADEVDTSISGENIDAVIAKGVKAWRTNGTSLGGAACANCHAPDAMDLAYFDFDEETIRRRAESHVGMGNTLSQRDVDKIVKLVKAQRAKYNIDPKDPMEARPLQPGGEVLAGTSAEERDYNFGKYLQEKGFRFANIPVLSKEEALKQRDEWLELDPRKIKIGIPFNRWSEDPHHGSEHATMADWLPDLPRIPREGKADQWYGLQDDYLQNPTDKNFWKMFEYEIGLTRPITESNSNRFFNEKYQSVLMAQHFFRKEVMKGEKITDRPTTVFMPIKGEDRDNPVWDVGSIAHVLRNGELRGEEFELSNRIKEQNSDLKEDMNRMRVPWFYAGWLLDQGLQHSGEGEITESGRYFTLHMHIDDSHPTHNIFMITRKMVVENFDSKTQDISKPLVINYSRFDEYNFALEYAPDNKEADKIYKLITGNSYRMMLILLKQEIKENGIPAGNSYVLENWLDTIEDFKSFTEQVRSRHHQYNLQLISEVEASL